MTKNRLLNVISLKTYFFTYQGTVYAVDGVTFHVNASESVGLVGETGCGKSVTARSILRLINPPGKIMDGKIIFEGEDILSMSEKEIRNKVRGHGIAVVLQKPMSSLNPVFTIGQQFLDILKRNHEFTKKQAVKVAKESLEAVTLSDPDRILQSYPHELSGGMQQRVQLAMALACEAKLLIADEPTTALDVSVQLQVLKLINSLQREKNMALLLISHDLAVISNMCDHIVVMYAGTVVEDGPKGEIITAPQHPYTQGLIKAVPGHTPRGQKLGTLKGEVPNLLAPPKGCRFYPRCPYSRDICREQRPEMRSVSDAHFVACHNVQFNSNKETSGYEKEGLKTEALNGHY